MITCHHIEMLLMISGHKTYGQSKSALVMQLFPYNFRVIWILISGQKRYMKSLSHTLLCRK